MKVNALIWVINAFAAPGDWHGSPWHVVGICLLIFGLTSFLGFLYLILDGFTSIPESDRQLRRLQDGTTRPNEGL